jgi:hypothetical protein
MPLPARPVRACAVLIPVILAGICGWTACARKAGHPAAAPPPPPAAVATAAGTGQNKERITHVLELLASLWAYDRSGRDRRAQRISFEIPETAINEYIGYALRLGRRPGIESLMVKLLPHNAVQANVVIDFDAVERWNPGTVPLRLKPVLHGQGELHLNAQFQAQDGIFSFTLQAAEDPAHKPIPTEVAAGILRSVAAQQPERYDISEPIPLPFGLQRVWTENQVLYGNT